MDVRYINPFMKSIKNLFQTMLTTDVSFGKPFVPRPDDDSRPDVSGVIGFSGDASGAVVIAFGKETAVRAASQFAGTNLHLDHPDFADAIGELANMIAGGAKAEFEGLDVNISLPSVIVGERHEVTNSKVHPGLAIPCNTPLGNFRVHVSMKVEQAAAVGAGS